MNIKEFVQNTVRRALARYESTRPAPTLAVTSKILWSGSLSETGTISLNENDTNYDVIEIFGYARPNSGSGSSGTTSLLLTTYYTSNVSNGAVLTFSSVQQTEALSISRAALVRTNNRTLSYTASSSYPFSFTRVIGRKYVQST